MKKNNYFHVFILTSIAVIAMFISMFDKAILAGGPNAIPSFKVDPFWPRPLPNNWIIGQVSGIAVDSQDHIWIAHRPISLEPDEVAAAQKPPTALCCISAPPIIEFDAQGNLIQAWGGPGEGYDWP